MEWAVRIPAASQGAAPDRRTADAVPYLHPALPELPSPNGDAQRDPEIVAAVELGRIRTVMAVPMLKENELIGAFIVDRHEVRPFTDKQIALVGNFGAQAVIAVENSRC
jgi:GAF domain-containing protein